MNAEAIFKPVIPLAYDNLKWICFTVGYAKNTLFS